MQAYSAAEAISPAIERTRSFLFRPFRLGTFLKLALVAALTDGGGSFSGNVPSGNHHHSHSFVSHSFLSHSASGLPFSAADLGVLVILPAALLALALILWLWYLLVRLRFAYFHCLAYGTRQIRDGWHPYAQPAMRLYQLQLVVAACVLAGLAVLAVPFVFAFRGAFAGGGQPDPAQILLMIAVAAPVILVLAFFSLAYEIITHDFMLPHMALENATAGEAWRASLGRYRAQKGSFWLYGLLRVLLSFVGSMAALMVLAIPALIVVLIAVAVFAGLNAALANASVMAHTVLLTVEIVLGVAGVALALLVGISLGGTIATWKRQYALLFYGGRFGALGDLISPPPPQPPPLPETPAVA